MLEKGVMDDDKITELFSRGLYGFISVSLASISMIMMGVGLHDI